MKNLKLINMIIPYEDLDKHFKAPKDLNTKPFYSYKRLPRKLKKSFKKQLIYNYNINEMLWCYMEINHKRFIIKKICEIYNK